MHLPFGRPSIALAATLAALAFGSPHLRAQKATETDSQRTAQGTTEVGLLDGVPYRIDIPNDWNHSLVVYYHGYKQHPITFPIGDRLDGKQQPLFDRHFAIAQSAYSQAGWATQQAFPESELLRRHFIKLHGQPKETYVAGESMGGALVAATLELSPEPYLGGLDLCGAVGPTSEAFERRFALRAAFDHYFPGLMPPLVPTPPEYDATQSVRDRIMAALKSNPTAATELRNLMQLHTDADVAYDIAYFTFVIGDMQRRSGGNPFDNRNFIYTGTNPASSSSDAELNDKVQRYSASPKAHEYLVRHYTPNGHLMRPMLAIHTIYDPLVPPSSLAVYSQTVESAGFGENLVQQYVHRDGHCNLTADKIGRAFDELLQWTHGAPRPEPGELRDPAPTEPRQQPRPSTR